MNNAFKHRLKTRFKALSKTLFKHYFHLNKFDVSSLLRVLFGSPSYIRKPLIIKWQWGFSTWVDRLMNTCCQLYDLPGSIVIRDICHRELPVETSVNSQSIGTPSVNCSIPQTGSATYRIILMFINSNNYCVDVFQHALARCETLNSYYF